MLKQPCWSREGTCYHVIYAHTNNAVNWYLWIVVVALTLRQASCDTAHPVAL